MSLKAIPGFVWLVVAVHIVLLIVGSLARPLLDIPDEKFHVDMIVAVSEGAGWPAVGGRKIGPVASISVDLQQKAGYLKGTASRLESTAIPRRTADSSTTPVCKGSLPPSCEYRPTFVEIEEEYPDAVRLVNRMTQHPPLFYVVTQGTAHAALAIAPLPGGVPFDLQILSYRWVSILLVAPLPILIYALATMLAESETARRTATLFPLMLAGLEMRNGSMVNNDNLLLLLATLLTLVLVCLIIDGATRRRTVAIGVLTGLALFTKGLALVLPAVVIIAFLIRWFQHRDEAKALFRNLVGVGILSFVAGGWWWFRNLAVYGQIQPTGRPTPPGAGLGFEPIFIDWLNRLYPTVLRGFWGEQLWSGNIGRWLPIVVTGVLLILVTVGVVASSRRGALLMALSPLVFTAITVGAKSWDVYTFEGAVRGGQGRYAYPAIAAISVAFGIGLWRVLKRVHAGHLAVVIAAVTVVAVEVWSFLRLLVTRWGTFGANDLATSYGGFVAWSPLPPIITNLIIVLFAIGCIALVVGAARESISERRSLPEATRSPWVFRRLSGVER